MIKATSLLLIIIVHFESDNVINILYFYVSVAGSDYVAGPLQATFPTTSVEGSTSCVDIRILQDLALEGDHSFGVEVISATPSVVLVGTPSEETVTILDDESM